MKNSPEHILKKMYTSEKRAWSNNCGFRSQTNIGLTHIYPIAVVPLTGNTTVKMEMQHYLQTEGTPLPLYEGMRVDVDCFFLPQRLYTRGLYGNNLTESIEVDKLPLPRASIVDRDIYGDVSSGIKAVLRGSLLNRLGVAPQMILPGGNRPLRPEMVMYEEEILAEVLDGGINSRDVYVNMAVVAGYYDICRTRYMNTFVNEVPISFTRSVLSNRTPAGELYDLTASTGSFNAFYDTSSFGQYINYLRGVANFYDDDVPMVNEIFYNDEKFSVSNGLSFVVPLLDSLDEGSLDDLLGLSTVKDVARALNNEYSITGLWPNRLDSHFQTMFFDENEINSLTRSISIGGDVESFRLAESKFALTLKKILRGRTMEDWIDVQYGNTLKINDEPIFVGRDSFMVSYQQIVSSATTNSDKKGERLGDTSSRGVGGTAKAYDDKGNAVSKPIVFTTQEPGYMMVLCRCTPEVSYPDVHERFHEYDTLDDFPLPIYSGKLFQPLKSSDMIFTGLETYDNIVIGQQPYGFDYMTSFNRSSCKFASSEEGSVFNRKFDLAGLGSFDPDVLAYLQTVYVEPDVYDENFYDNGVNGRLPFKLISLFDIRKCMPLEKQVTDYSI